MSAVEQREGDGDDAPAVLDVWGQALGGAEGVVLPFFDDRQGEHAGADQHHAEQL